MDGGSGIVLDLARGKFYSLTPTAVAITQSLVGGVSFDDLLEDLQTKFSVPREQLERDLTAFLEKMEQAGLCRTM